MIFGRANRRLAIATCAAALYLTIATGVCSAETEYVGRVERLAQKLDALVRPDTKLEVLADGFEWCEGPVWVERGKFLIFSDIPVNTLFRWDAERGSQVYLKPSGYTGDTPRGGELGSNGLLLDGNGRLVLCQHGDRRVGRMNASLDAPSPDFETLADRFEGKRFNSPNDAVLHSSGDLYFTDPPYGLEKYMNDPAKELSFQGVYVLRQNGSVELLTAEMSRPNGIAFSPDEQTLYVANSDPENPIWMAFPIKADGTVGRGRILFDASEQANQPESKGSPDGMSVDVSGNLWATGPGGVLVISPAGKHLGTLVTTQATSNCAFGEDGSTLFITADRYLLRARVLTRGLGYGRD